MEVLSSSLYSEFCLKPFMISHVCCSKFPLGKVRYGFLSRKVDVGVLGRNLGRNGGFVVKSVVDGGESEEKELKEWELEFIGKGKKAVKKKKEEVDSGYLGNDDDMDWCVRAREHALRSIQGRGMESLAEKMVTKSTPKKKKKKKKTKKEKESVAESKKAEKKAVGDELNDLDSDDLFGGEGDDDDDGVGWDGTRPFVDPAAERLRQAVSMFGDGMFEEKKKEQKNLFVQRLTQFKGKSDMNKAVQLNRAIVNAQTAADVLEVVSEMMMAVGKGLSPSPLTPLNLATALHRIAKNMEKVSMTETHRLEFTRQRDMSMLVGIAMSALPECSAQGISNIAWALSKMGGQLLYLTEMDRVAEVALTKVDEFNSQNVANVAGAFASMRHSAPDLFPELSKKAASIIHTFRAQEISQLLWAFAFLNEPAGPLLKALDNVYKNLNQFQCFSDYGYGSSETLDPPILRLNRHCLGNISWSYAVLGQMDRGFFYNVWKTLQNFGEESFSDDYREDVLFASQVYLANQCLKVEYSHLSLALGTDAEDKFSLTGRSSRFNDKVTSSFQKEVERQLYSTGLQWVIEYELGPYSVDAAVFQDKLAFEIDGPTHFSRNTWVPLGSTMLKRRIIAALGWNLVSVSQLEWDDLQGSDEQDAYLNEKLKKYLGGDDTNPVEVAGELEVPINGAIKFH